MLTNVFYYDLYLPYLLSHLERTGAVIQRKQPITQRAEIAPNAAFMMNKALKLDVLNYVRGISEAVNGTRESARFVISEMRSFNQNAFEHGLLYASKMVSVGLARFAKAHNNSVEFMESQEHSPFLYSFAQEIIELFDGARYELAMMHLLTDDGRTLTFDPKGFESRDVGELNSAFSNSIGLFSEVYRGASQLLTAPLTEHINFRNLSYYYNYKLGTVIADTFKLIDSGIIINTKI